MKPQPTPPMNGICAEVRESRSALPSTQGNRGSSSPDRSLQRHSAGHIKSSPIPDPGIYISENGISNIYASSDVQSEQPALLNLAVRDSYNDYNGDGKKNHVADTCADYRFGGDNDELAGDANRQNCISGVSNAAASYVTPLPVSSGRFDGTVGKCERHNLEKCVLCSLFHSKNSTQTTASSYTGHNTRSDVNVQWQAPSYFEPNAACQAHDLKNCLLCRMKAEEETGSRALSSSNVSQYIQSKSTNQPDNTSFPWSSKSPSNHVFDYQGLSDSEYIKKSVGREGLMKFEEARQQYEKALMRGTERRGVETKVQPNTYGNVKYDDEENEQEIYERFDLTVMNSRVAERLHANWNNCEEGEEDKTVTVDKYLETNPGSVNGNSMVIYEDDEYISMEKPEGDKIDDIFTIGGDGYHDHDGNCIDGNDSPARKNGSRRETNDKSQDERNHKRSLPSLNAKMTREVRFNVKSDTISAYAPPPERRKKVVKKLTKAPRLNDPSISIGVKSSTVLNAKREMQDAKKSMQRVEKKLHDGLSNDRAKSRKKSNNGKI